MRRHAIRDDQWDRIKYFLPAREGDPAARWTRASGSVAATRLCRVLRPHRSLAWICSTSLAGFYSAVDSRRM